MQESQRIRTAEELGRALRLRRRASGATQHDLAELANVSVKFVSELERGKETAELGLALRALQRAGLDLWVVPRGTPPPGLGDG